MKFARAGSEVLKEMNIKSFDSVAKRISNYNSILKNYFSYHAKTIKWICLV